MTEDNDYLARLAQVTSKLGRPEGYDILTWIHQLVENHNRLAGQHELMSKELLEARQALKAEIDKRTSNGK